MKDFKERTKDLIYAIENLDEIQICPSIFSDDIEKHDCDNCPSSKFKTGDCFDQTVCRDCWIEAIHNCKSK